jgi:hypothetical protein
MGDETTMAQEHASAGTSPTYANVAARGWLLGSKEHKELLSPSSTIASLPYVVKDDV